MFHTGLYLMLFLGGNYFYPHYFLLKMQQRSIEVKITEKVRLALMNHFYSYSLDDEGNIFSSYICNENDLTTVLLLLGTPCG